MPAYVICSYDIADPKGFEAYVPGVMPLLQKHGAEIVVADFSAKAVEGRPASVQVILKFESEEAAERWYHDPEYTPVKQIRLASTKNGSMVFVKQAGPAD